MLSLLRLDATVSQFLSQLLPHNQISDNIFLFLSAQGLTIVIWGILFVYYLYRERLDGTAKQFLISFLISFGTTAIFVNVILKNIFMRIRPWIEMGINNSFCPTDYSFPSGHASGAFAGAVIFAHFDKKRSWLYYSIAIGISYSRIYLQCHYLLDVLIGAVIGGVIGFGTLKILAGRKIL